MPSSFFLPNSECGLCICVIGSKKRRCIFTRRSCPALTHIKHTEDKDMLQIKKEQMRNLRKPYLVNTGKNHTSAWQSLYGRVHVVSAPNLFSFPPQIMKLLTVRNVWCVTMMWQTFVWAVVINVFVLRAAWGFTWRLGLVLCVVRPWIPSNHITSFHPI